MSLKFGVYLAPNGCVYKVEQIDNVPPIKARIWENEHVVCLINGPFACADEIRLKYREILSNSIYIGEV